MKSTMFLLISFAFFAGADLSAFSYVKARYEEDDFLYRCCAPLDFNQPHAIHDFLQNVFRAKRYATEYMPFNLHVHVKQILDHGKAMERKAAYLESVLRLFYNKMKTCRFVSGDAVLAMLETLPECVKNYTACADFELALEQAQETMMDVFIPSFLNDFDFFKQDPQNFLKKLSQDLTLMIKKKLEVQECLCKEQCKQMFVRFVDFALVKAMWDASQPEAAWECVKKIAVQLEGLVAIDLINLDELDDLYHTLLESFVKFLDLAHGEISIDTLQAIKDEVASGSLLLVELEEQEECLETKKERLLDNIVEIEAKKEANALGIITDTIV